MGGNFLLRSVNQRLLRGNAPRSLNLPINLLVSSTGYWHRDISARLTPSRVPLSDNALSLMICVQFCICPFILLYLLPPLDTDTRIFQQGWHLAGYILCQTHSIHSLIPYPVHPSYHLGNDICLLCVYVDCHPQSGIVNLFHPPARQGWAGFRPAGVSMVISTTAVIVGQAIMEKSSKTTELRGEWQRIWSKWTQYGCGTMKEGIYKLDRSKVRSPNISVMLSWTSGMQPFSSFSNSTKVG